MTFKPKNHLNNDLLAQNGPFFAIDAAGAILLFLLTSANVLFGVSFAELHIYFIQAFPVFVGEMVLALCFCLFIGHCVIKGALVRRSFLWYWIAYGIWILIKAVFGYRQTGGYALRNAALFYYPFVGLFTYIFFRGLACARRKKDDNFFDKGRPKFIYVIALIIALGQVAVAMEPFGRYCVSASLAGLFCLSTQPVLIWSGLLVVFLGSFLAGSLDNSCRTHIVALVAAGMFLVVYFFSVWRIRGLLKWILGALTLTLVVAFIVSRSDVNAVKSLVTWSNVSKDYLQDEERIRKMEQFYVQKPMKARIFNPNLPEHSFSTNSNNLVGAVNANAPKKDSIVNPTNLLSNGNFESWSAGTSSAPDGWILRGNGADVTQESSTKKLGTCAVKLTGTMLHHGAALIRSINTEKDIAFWKGRTVTFGCWVYAASANVGRILLSDGIGLRWSAFHTGNSTWQWLTVTRTISSSATSIRFICQEWDAVDTIYVAGAMCVEGSSAFAFSPAPSDTVVKDIRVRPSPPKSADAVKSRVAMAFSKPEPRSLGQAYGNISFRLFIWRDMAEEFFREKPFLSGFSFGHPQRSRSIEILGLAWGEWYRDGWITPHNSFLHLIYRGGMVGLAVIVLLLALLTRAVFIFASARSITGGFLASIIIFGILSSCFSVFLELPYMAIPFWFFFGVTMAYGQHLKEFHKK